MYFKAAYPSPTEEQATTFSAILAQAFKTVPLTDSLNKRENWDLAGI